MCNLRNDAKSFNNCFFLSCFKALIFLFSLFAVLPDIFCQCVLRFYFHVDRAINLSMYCY